MESWSSIIQAGAAIATTFLTLFIILYAKKTIEYTKVTIEEGKKDRRKETIEKQLENLYSPLRETLWRAKKGNEYHRQTTRDIINRVGVVDYVIKNQELDDILTRIKTFGHYLNPEIRESLTQALGQSEETQHPDYRQIQNAYIDPHFKYIDEKQKLLTEEFIDLTRTSDNPSREATIVTPEEGELNELLLLVGGMSGAIISQILRLVLEGTYVAPSWFPLQGVYSIAAALFFFFLFSWAAISLVLVPIFRAAIKTDAWISRQFSRAKRWQENKVKKWRTKGRGGLGRFRTRL